MLLWYFPENASFILTPYFSLTLEFPTKAWVAPAFFLWKLFCFVFMSFPFFPPSRCWPRIFPTSLIWTAPLSLRLVNGPGGLDADLLCCSACASSCSVEPHTAQSESARLDCPSAPFKSGAPPTTTTCFTSLSTDPPPPPLCSPHSPTPTLLPHPPSSQTGPRTLSHAAGAYVFHLDSPPHLWACRSPGPPSTPPIYNVILFFTVGKEEKTSESDSTSTDNQHCNTVLPELKFFPRVTVFFLLYFLSNCSIGCCCIAVINSSMFAFLLHRLRFHNTS